MKEARSPLVFWKPDAIFISHFCPHAVAPKLAKSSYLPAREVGKCGLSDLPWGSCGGQDKDRMDIEGQPVALRETQLLL